MGSALLPLLRHYAALGLWRLAVATTSTEPESAIHLAVFYTFFPETLSGAITPSDCR
jgi:hypothetical protein